MSKSAFTFGLGTDVRPGLVAVGKCECVRGGGTGDGLSCVVGRIGIVE